MSHYDLSIIILNYRTAGLLKQCLKGIKMFEHQIDYEIIVIDNHSGKKEEKILKEEIKEKWPEIKLIMSQKNIGYAAGVNLGIKEASGKYLLILNPDIVIFEDSLKKMYHFMENHPKVGLGGVKLVNPNGSVQMSCRKFSNWLTPLFRRTFLGQSHWGKKYLSSYLLEDFNHNENRPVDWVQGSCLIVRRNALEKVGLMDERFFLYLSDEDWCRRFWQAGLKVYYIARAYVVHYYQRESAENLILLSLFNPASRAHILDWLKYMLKWN